MCIEVMSIPILGGGDGEDAEEALDQRERTVQVDHNYEVYDGWEQQWREDKEAEMERMARELMERETEQEKEEWEASEKVNPTHSRVPLHCRP